MLTFAQTFNHNLLAEMNREVQQLHHDLYPAVFKSPDPVEAAEYFRLLLQADTAKAYVALQDDVACGYVLLFIKESPESPFQYARHYILLDQLVVSQNYHNTGVGTALLKEVYTLARSLDISNVELNHWSLNEAAAGFFTKNGFTYFNKKMSIELIH